MTKKAMTKEEVAFFLDYIEKCPVITARQTNAFTNKLKDAAWMKLTKTFNEKEGFNPKSTTSLKLKWDNLKKAARKRAQEKIANSMKLPHEDLLDRVISVLTSNDSLECTCDNDRLGKGNLGFEVVDLSNDEVVELPKVVDKTDEVKIDNVITESNPEAAKVNGAPSPKQIDDKSGIVSGESNSEPAKGNGADNPNSSLYWVIIGEKSGNVDSECEPEPIKENNTTIPNPTRIPANSYAREVSKENGAVSPISLGIQDKRKRVNTRTLKDMSISAYYNAKTAKMNLENDKLKLEILKLKLEVRLLEQEVKYNENI